MSFLVDVENRVASSRMALSRSHLLDQSPKPGIFADDRVTPHVESTNRSQLSTHGSVLFPDKHDQPIPQRSSLLLYTAQVCSSHILFNKSVSSNAEIFFYKFFAASTSIYEKCRVICSAGDISPTSLHSSLCCRYWEHIFFMKFGQSVSRTMKFTKTYVCVKIHPHA